MPRSLDSGESFEPAANFQFHDLMFGVDDRPAAATSAYSELRAGELLPWHRRRVLAVTASALSDPTQVNPDPERPLSAPPDLRVHAGAFPCAAAAPTPPPSATRGALSGPRLQCYSIVRHARRLALSTRAIRLPPPATHQRAAVL